MGDHWTEEELRERLVGNPDLARLNRGLPALPPEPKVRKYRNEPTVYKGREYASIKEANRARLLDALQANGEIEAWIPQVTLNLAPGVNIRVDFVILMKGMRWRAEDTKGFRTPDWKIKAKLFKAKYGEAIIEL
jgi:hypothetical protein